MGSSPIWGTMKNKIAPEWVLQALKAIKQEGVDLYSWSNVTEYCTSIGWFDMLDWIRDNRDMFTYVVMSEQYEYIDFYHGTFP